MLLHSSGVYRLGGGGRECHLGVLGVVCGMMGWVVGWVVEALWGDGGGGGGSERSFLSLLGVRVWNLGSCR